MNYTAETIDRTHLAYIEQHGCSVEEAQRALDSMVLKICAGDKIRTSFALQAALLTAINVGKRAFLGGIILQLPDDLPCLIAVEKSTTFNEVARRLCGDRLKHNELTESFELRFGLEADIKQNSLEVVANSWQGGYLTRPGESGLPDDSDSLPIGGVFAAGLAVGTAFLRVTGIERSAGNTSAGLSLWKPELNWRSSQSVGPAIDKLPKRYWILGLGHLGQAYCWTIGLLPYAVPQDVCLLLQDYGKMRSGNYSAGLLTESNQDKKRKTRICSDWLEARGFETTITERSFDTNTIRCDEEPFIALCGFDNAKSRTYLDISGFSLIVEASLGGGLIDFDRITFHTFPDSSKAPKEIWGGVVEQPVQHGNVKNQMKKAGVDDCGSVEIAGKSISVSFVGACAAALAIGELIRAANGGQRYEACMFPLRAPIYKTIVPHSKGLYTLEIAENGFSAIYKNRVP